MDTGTRTRSNAGWQQRKGQAVAVAIQGRQHTHTHARTQQPVQAGTHQCVQLVELVVLGVCHGAHHGDGSARRRSPVLPRTHTHAHRARTPGAGHAAHTGGPRVGRHTGGDTRTPACAAPASVRAEGVCTQPGHPRCGCRCQSLHGGCAREVINARAIVCVQLRCPQQLCTKLIVHCDPQARFCDDWKTENVGVWHF